MTVQSMSMTLSEVNRSCVFLVTMMMSTLCAMGIQTRRISCTQVRMTRHSRFGIDEAWAMGAKQVYS